MHGAATGMAPPLVEILAVGEGLAQLPVGSGDVVELEEPAVGGGDTEGDALPGEVAVGLPVGAPVPGHGDPPRGRALDLHRADGPRPGDVEDEHELEVPVAVDGEAHAAGPGAGHPLVEDRDDAAAVDADLLPRRLGHVEVLPRRVAPPAVVAGLGVVGRAQVGGGDGHRHARLAPPAVLLVALHLVALPARRAAVEHRQAQRRRVRAVPRRVQVAIPARATCTSQC